MLSGACCAGANAKAKNEISDFLLFSMVKKKGKLVAYAIKRVAAGAHLPTPWFLSRRNVQTIEPTTAWAPDDRADYCLDTRR